MLRNRSPLLYLPRRFTITQLAVIGGTGLKVKDDVHYRTLHIGYWLVRNIGVKA